MANITQRGLTDNPGCRSTTTSSSPGRRATRTTARVVAFDPEKAKPELDALGLDVPEDGQFREKDGKQLVIRNVFYDSLSTRQMAPDRAEQPRLRSGSTWSW